MQLTATGWTRTLGRCGEDTASVQGTHAPPTERLRREMSTFAGPISLMLGFA